MFYNNQQRRDVEDDVHMRDECIDIRNFYACQGTGHLLHEDVIKSISTTFHFRDCSGAAGGSARCSAFFVLMF